jgi:hypothetical protein
MGLFSTADEMARDDGVLARVRRFRTGAEIRGSLGLNVARLTDRPPPFDFCDLEPT